MIRVCVVNVQWTAALVVSHDRCALEHGEPKDSCLVTDQLSMTGG